MKRRKLTPSGMSKPESSAPECSTSNPTQLPIVSGSSSVQTCPGVVLVHGRELAVSNAEKGLAGESSNLPRVAELSLNGTEGEPQGVDFNDRFPDELLLSIFKFVWHPMHCWETAKVCKRWCVLQSLNLLKRRSNHAAGSYPCTGRIGRPGQAHPCKEPGGPCGTLKLKKVESQWRLAYDLLLPCRRHTHGLEISDCTHVSPRGYQLIAGFASNLKTLKLHSCNAVDDASLGAILGSCPRLQILHLSNVTKLTLKNIEKNAPGLRELEVHGCPKVTMSVVLSVLNGCHYLRSLSLSAMGSARDWDESKLVEGPPYKLQTLELGKTRADTDALLLALTKRFSNLRWLNLTNCPHFSDVGLMALNDSCGGGLQRLVVTWCDGVSDKSVRALAAVATNLQDVSLAGTNVSDDALEALMSSAAVVSKLRNLSVAGCKRISDAGLQHIVSKQSDLGSFKSLDVQNCPEVSENGLKALRDSMRKKPWKIVSKK